MVTLIGRCLPLCLERSSMPSGTIRAGNLHFCAEDGGSLFPRNLDTDLLCHNSNASFADYKM
jgi:hypothetical protein